MGKEGEATQEEHPLMAKRNHSKTDQEETSRLIIELPAGEARDFLLKQACYFSLDLPIYFKFENLLQEATGILKEVRQETLLKARNFDQVNHTILNSKDGKYAWRPMDLIHPLLYASLVSNLTNPIYWEEICNRFKVFQSNPQIECLSLPVQSLNNQSDKAQQINRWWQEVEQKSIALSLDYEFMIRTDIVDCYASMYTHSIAWAVHTKEIAKRNRTNTQLIGNIIDNHIQNMRRGQTNGIPQGSTLMDMIAELVLGYADLELASRIEREGISDYHILRYRDDYRILTNERRQGEVILKILTEELIKLGLKLNPEKTDSSAEVIRSSIKPDKIDWMFRKQGDHSLQKHLLIIHDHSIRHPNSGSIVAALKKYYRRIHRISGGGPSNVLQLISIVTDITYRNPKAYPQCWAILSKLISFLNDSEQKGEMIKKILKKFSHLPNTGHLEIWLQRVSHNLELDTDFDETLCRLVRKENSRVWNSDWIESPHIRAVFDSANIVDFDELEGMEPVIPIDEVELYDEVYP